MPCIAALLRAQARLLDRQNCCASARVRIVEHSPSKHVCGPRLSKAHKRLHAQSRKAYTYVVARYCALALQNFVTVKLHSSYQVCVVERLLLFRGAPLDLDALELQTPDIDNDLQSYQACIADLSLCICIAMLKTAHSLLA